MKRVVSIALCLIVCLAAESFGRGSIGSAFGALTTGRCLPKRGGTAGLGVGVGVGSPHRNSVNGYFSYGTFEYVETTLKLGLSDADEVRVTVGGDVKYQFLDAGPALGDPIDLSAGCFAEYVTDVFQFGVQAIGSRTYILPNTTQALSPYGRLQVRLESVKSKSEIEFGLNAGVRWDVTPNFSLFGELQLDGNEGIFLGLKESVL